MGEPTETPDPLAFMDPTPTPKTPPVEEPYPQTELPEMSLAPLEEPDGTLTLGSAPISKLGSLVHGTNKAYRFVAYSLTLRAGYVLDDGTLSFRIEGKSGHVLNHELRDWLAKQGYMLHPTYASIHLQVGDDTLLAQKTLGSLIFATSMEPGWWVVGWDYTPLAVQAGKWL